MGIPFKHVPEIHKENWSHLIIYLQAVQYEDIYCEFAYHSETPLHDLPTLLEAKVHWQNIAPVFVTFSFPLFPDSLEFVP